MTQIRLYRHPFASEAPQVFEAPSIAQWLLSHYGEHPPGGLAVYAGEPSVEADVTRNIPALVRNDAAYYVVLETPGGPFLPILVNLAISVVLAVVARSWAATVDKPLDNRSQESPNNALTARENRVRHMERVEDIFGTVRSIPTVIMPAYDKYIDHRKVEFGLYCVTRGYCIIEDVREGDTLLSSITGASAAFYDPFTSPNSGDPPQLLIGDAIIDHVLRVSSSSSVEDIVLHPSNQLQLTSPNDYFLRGPGAQTAVPVIPASTGDILFQPENRRNPNFAAVAEVGQSITFDTGNYATGVSIPAGALTVTAATKRYTTTVTGAFRGLVDGLTMTVAGGLGNALNLGAKTVVSHTGETVTVSDACADDTNALDETTMTFTARHSGTRTIAVVGTGYVELSGANFAPGAAVPYANVSMTATLANGLTDWTDWYTLPQADRTEVWTNVVARQGMYRDDGSKSDASVSYEVQIEQLDALLNPTGLVETITGGLSGSTASERAETLERVTSWVGPARVRARRTTPFDYGFAGALVDEITWVNLYAVAPVDKAHFGNKTIVHTVTRSSPGATAVRRRELNCLASRLLPTYDGAVFSGSFDADGVASGSLEATSRIVDILAAVTLDPRIGGRTLDDLDIEQVWEVQQALDAWHPQVGQFNYTFDNDTISYEETVAAIADAAFCRVYRQNGQIRLALDRPQASSVALFSHRNKKPDAETITRRFANDADYDGVELLYVDPETETQETIRLPLDGSYTKLKRVEVTGIRSYEQAWFRANREYNRLRFERLAIETIVTTDARALLPNARVNIVDNTVFRSFDGEVRGQAGLELTLSGDVEFEAGEAHSIILQKRDGTIQSITATAGSAANKVVLALAPAEAIVTEPTPEEGIRTSYSFASDTGHEADAWLVHEISLTDDGYVKLRCINYAAEYYSADGLAVPAKAGVIND